MNEAVLGGGDGSTGKKIVEDSLLAGIGIMAAMMDTISGLLAISISGLMVVLLSLRVYNEYRKARRQDMKDERLENDEVD